MSKRPSTPDLHGTRIRPAPNSFKQRVSILVTRVGKGLVSYRILVAGEYYDVGSDDLALLRQGQTPYDLRLTPAPPLDDDLDS